MDRKRADRRQFHYIYKITRFDGRYYIGFHSTDNLEDGYFGSGKRLRYSINYHGLEKHTKEILEFLPDRLSLKKREAELVNEDCLKDPLCMNLKLGGEGGWDWVNKNPNIQQIGGFFGRAALAKKLNEDPTFKDYLRKNGSKCFKGLHVAGKIKYDTFTGKKHTEETKRKIGLANSLHQKENSSQFGTMWITNGILSKKIKKYEDIPDGWIKGRIILQK